MLPSSELSTAKSQAELHRPMLPFLTLHSAFLQKVLSNSTLPSAARAFARFFTVMPPAHTSSSSAFTVRFSNVELNISAFTNLPESCTSLYMPLSILMLPLNILIFMSGTMQAGTCTIISECLSLHSGSLLSCRHILPSLSVSVSANDLLCSM